VTQLLGSGSRRDRPVQSAFSGGIGAVHARVPQTLGTPPRLRMKADFSRRTAGMFGVSS
jgi:hypothetical protein